MNDKQKEYHRLYMRRWRVENPERTKATAHRNWDRNSRRVYLARRARFDALKDGPCVDCGERYPPYVMQWDHREGSNKLFTIGQSSRIAWHRVLAEVAKCDLVCANCHCVRTHERVQAA